ncbi:MAG: hypothetical protein Q8Q89_03240 [bacterium]|nr:hypothetical protein [bacterium]
MINKIKANGHVVLMVMAPVALMGFLFTQNGASQKSAPPVTQSGTKPATPAQPFPGERMPAIPALSANKYKPQTENTIYIHSPAGGAGWVRGQIYSSMPIEWSWNLKGNVERFTINLLKGGQFYKKLATVNTRGWSNNYGSWQWDIPLDTPTGNDYKIEVSTTLGKQKISAVNFLPFAILGEAVTVKGRFVDWYTQEPVSDVSLVSYPDSSDRVDVNANGEFAYTVSTDSSRVITKSYLYGASCYMQGLITTNQALGSSPFSPNIFNQNQVANFNTFDAYSKTRFVTSDYAITPILSDTVNLDPQLWSAANVQIISDIPVKVAMDYSRSDYTDIPDYLFSIYTNYTHVSGDYSTTALLKNVIPSDYNVRVFLMDQAGNKYASPVYGLGRKFKCQTATLNFTNKEFRWSFSQ